jgi:hypothetical protein
VANELGDEEMSVYPIESEEITEELLSDEELEALAGVEQEACTNAGTQRCTCGGNVTCHHHD